MFIVFARIEDDKYITGFIVENDPKMVFPWGMRKKIGNSLLLYPSSILQRNQGAC